MRVPGCQAGLHSVPAPYSLRPRKAVVRGPQADPSQPRGKRGLNPGRYSKEEYQADGRFLSSALQINKMWTPCHQCATSKLQSLFKSSNRHALEAHCVAPFHYAVCAWGALPLVPVRATPELCPTSRAFHHSTPPGHQQTQLFPHLLPLIQKATLFF